MCSVPTYGAYENIYVRTYDTHENMMFLGLNDFTYDKFICPNLYQQQKYDVFCPNLRYIRKWVMSEYEMYSALMLHTEI